MGKRIPPRVNPSGLDDYTCLMRYQQTRLLKSSVREEGFSRALAYGTGVHEAARVLFDPTVATPPAERNVDAAVARAFTHPKKRELIYPDAALRDADIVRAAQAMTAYVATDADVAHTRFVEVFAEAQVFTSDGDIAFILSGKFDRLIVRPGAPHHLVIRDYKTGVGERDDLRPACIMAAIALKQYKAFDTVSVEFDYLDASGLAQRKTFYKDDVKAVWPSIKALPQRVIAACDADEWPAEPGEHCRFCPMRPTCQPGGKATVGEMDVLFD